MSIDNSCPSNTDKKECEDIYRTGIQIKKLVRTVHEFEKNMVKMPGLSILQSDVLFLLYQISSTNMYDLSVRMNSDTSTITRVIDKLEQEGLVNRIHSEEDKRVMIVSLSAHGKDKAIEMCKAIKIYYEKVIENISQVQQKEILKSISMLTDAMNHANNTLISSDE